MNTPEIIKITTDINGEQLVSGRELHKFLEVKTRYNDWFTDMTQYGFIENVDYTSFTEKRVKPQGGRPSIDHAIKLDMAKEISMIQRTDKGKEARQYFIKVEKEHKKQIAIPTTHRELAQLALAVTEETNQRVDDIDDRLTEVEENRLISTEDKNSIDRMIRRKVAVICKEQHLNQSAKKLLFTDIGRSIKELFSVPHRGRIKDKDFKRAVDFINVWEPSSVTKTQIGQMDLEIE